MKKSNHIILFFLVFFVFSLFSFPPRVLAQVDTIGGPTAVIRKVLDYLEKNKDKVLVKVGSKVYQSTLQAALNTIAFDAANYISSGGRGQKALWSKEYLSDFGDKVGNAAAGQFIDQLSKEWKVDLCSPPSAIKISMGLGLVSQNQPEFYKPNCSWQEMRSRWKSEIDKWEEISGNPWIYVNNIASSFHPTGNDVAMSLSLFDEAEIVSKAEKTKMEEQLKINNGWLDVRNAGGKSQSVPKSAEEQLKEARSSLNVGLGKVTGDILVDASNIFLNQLLIGSFNNLLKKIGEAAEDSADTFVNPFSSPNLDPNTYYSSSRATEALKKIIKPRFNVRSDYNILSDLIVCLSEENPAPNNCVIENNFSQAIQNKNTVAQAIDNSYLNPNFIFSDDVDYQSGLNNRSIMILRKFRIIPIGWEEAFARIQEKRAQKGFNYTLMDMISCYSPNDEFETFSQGFIRSNFENHSWCEGLIDPNWVLKAPLNYCKKQGYGAYIEAKQLVNVPEEIGGVSVDISPIIISRSANYCADEQSCIKERSDGSCELYGYCVEEKRNWNFGEDSCDPVFNTCESFTSSSNGKKLALLKNTIDYGSCNADNAGCSLYVSSGIFSSTTSKVAWNNSQSIYFNNKVESCSISSEGCTELIRTIPGIGHNFLVNGDFEQNLSQGNWSNFSTSSNSYSGNVSLELNTALNKNLAVAVDNYSIAGQSYTLSFYSSCSGSASSTVSLGSKNQDIAPSPGFEYQAITFNYPSNYSSSNIEFSIIPSPGNSCLIDNIKLERGTIGTFYSNYRGNGLVYQKMIPSYLESLCYQDPFSANPNYRLKSNAPSECFKYARICNKNEIGCDLFTSAYNIKITAKSVEKDYCPEQCVGYDVYVQNNTLFESNQVEKFIPGSALTCSANDSSCTEFTNLDTISEGGESREYYSSLKHCIKPSQGSCDSFYSWAGSDESGYQLKSFSLEKSNTGLIPKLTEGILEASSGIYTHKINGTIICSQNIHSLAISNPAYNPDCQEFYNQSGERIYALYSKTISCSEDCKVYRMTDKNINQEISNSSDCSALGSNISHWDSSLNLCYHCLGGGRWDSAQGACLYNAIPGEGKVCSASSNNCREYNGNSGNSVRIISSHDFNNGLSNWTDDVATSSESLSQGGKSMKVSGSAQLKVGSLVKEGSSYVIKFLAKNTQAKNISIVLANTDDLSPENISMFGLSGENNNFSLSLPANNDWKLYQVNLDNLNHKVTENEELIFSITSGSGEFYISNIVLLEISNRYYLIKNSWNTPNICYYDTANVYQGINYNLGCQNYSDRSNRNHSLRHFSSLCDNSAVGCEMMVKTNNHDSSQEVSFPDYNITIPADKFIPVVFSPEKSCSAENKGCSRFGKLIASNAYAVAQNIYQDVYLKNNPNKYDLILCSQSELGCDSWSSSDSSGLSYFKDPGDNICQWRKGADVGSNFAWYKKAVKKCFNTSSNNFSNNICLSATDCSAGQECKLDTRDFLCPVDSLKTIGFGGNSPIYQPKEEFGVKWTGLCPIAQSSCSEYLDPESSFSPNIVLNPNFSDLDGDGYGFDLWQSLNPAGFFCSVSSGSINCSSNAIPPIASLSINYIQTGLMIEPNKLYILKTNGSQNAKIECQRPIFQLNPITNQFSAPFTFLEVSPTSSKKIFYSGENNGNCSITYSKSNFNSLQFNDYQNQYLGFYNNLDNFNQKIASNNKNSFFNKLFKIKSVDAQNDDISIEIKPVAIDYQLSKNLDFSSCNASADLSKGCVLFNERVFNGISGLTPLNYNSSNYSSYASCNSANCDANKLISVQPDRVCGKWLSCYSYSYDQDSGEKICLEMGECTAFNYDGSCFNFAKAPDGVRNYSPGRDSNASGYSLLNNDYLANMSQLGQGNIIFSDNFENKINPLANWQLSIQDTNNNTSYIGASSTLYLVNKPNSDIIRNSKVTYPASGIAFLRFKKGDLGSGNGNFLISSAINLLPNSKYYLSLMTNTEDLFDNEFLNIKILGLDSSGNILWSDPISKSFTRAKQWQESSILIETKAEWMGGVKIIIETINSNNNAYVDNIRIEPVLEAVKNTKFIPATCRLYPSQDSLLCESENKNFIASGIYGYCLQKDPKNPEVCLLWYPVDAVKGRSSMSSSAFVGYPSTGGAKPYYCAQMNADFDFVEERGYYAADPYFIKKGDSDIFICPVNFEEFRFYGGKAWKELCKNMPSGGCDNGANLYRNYMGGWGLISSHCEGPDNSCTPTHGSINGCFNNENSAWTFRFCVSTRNSPDLFIKKTYELDHSFTKISMGTDPRYCLWKDYGGNNVKFTGGWYKYNGLQGGERGIKILAYNYPSCSSVGEEFACSDPNVTCPAGKNTACLMDVNKYTPLCSQIVQGEIPWAQRLKSSSNSIKNFYNEGSSGTDNVFSQYKLASPGNPYGAIVLGDATSPGSTVYAGKPATTTNSTQYGLPYSCVSSRQVYLVTSLQNACNSLYYDINLNTVLATTSLHSSFNAIRYSETHPIFNFKPYLKHIWLKVTSFFGSAPAYDDSYFEGNTTTIPSLSGSRASNDLSYKAYFPEISNIKLSNNLGIQVPASSNQIYTITNPGYYTLSFNTKVDLEQLPIKNLYIRIKNTNNNDWTGTDGLLEFSSLDQMSSSANPHRIIRYLNPGNYKILIKVQDNWGFYKCDGRNGFTTDDSCRNCCKDNFIDPNNTSTYCKDCP